MKKEEADKIYMEEMDALRASVKEEQARIMREYAGRVCPFKKGEVVQTSNGVGVVINGCIESVAEAQLPKVGVLVQLNDSTEKPILYPVDKVTKATKTQK